MRGKPVIPLVLAFSSTLAFAGEAKIKTEVAEFIFEKVPFRECHASTIVELPNGDLLAAWFGGRKEGDNSVAIWLSRKTVGGTWSAPTAVASYKEVPTWNPVLFRDANDRIWLFFKVGPMEESWVGAYRTSVDGGKTWSEITYLPAGLLGPVRNKPILLSNGNVLAGSSKEAGMLRGASHPRPYWSWASWAELSKDGGKTWTIHGPIVYSGVNFGLIQPTLWESEPGHIKMLLRSTELIGYICESSSTDGGITWTPAKATPLPNPDSGIDAVRMKDGRIALVYNHTKVDRTPLNLAFSTDNGATWGLPYVLEDAPGEYSYPAIIQSGDGKLHMTYTWKRKRIKHVVVDPNDIPRQ
jgi:predicted neuraminidase